jgi:hypothetical protein
LQEKGAKKKFTKRNAVRGFSPLARGEEGYAPSTAPPFEKRKRASTLGENFFVILMVLICLSVS